MINYSWKRLGEYDISIGCAYRLDQPLDITLVIICQLEVRIVMRVS